MAYLRDILPDLKMQLDFSVPAVKNVPEVCFMIVLHLVQCHSFFLHSGCVGGIPFG